MPQPNGQKWRRLRAKMQLTSDEAADRLGIAGGALRQIETNTKPVSLQLAFRAEEFYKEADPDLTVDDLIVAEDEPVQPQPQPAPKKVEPKVERTAPPGRDDGPRGRPPRAIQSPTAVGAA